MKFELSLLPYSFNALQPVISERTLRIHHDKHVQTYLNNLNTLIEATPWENMELIKIIKQSDGAIFNNAAQIWNHRFYFESLGAESTIKHRPEGALALAIEKKWGNLENFINLMNDSCATLFGSGWVWVSLNLLGELEITKEGNAGNPIIHNFIPLFCIDVWEHSYYLDYQNRRTEYVKEIWRVVNWEKIEERYTKSKI